MEGMWCFVGRTVARSVVAARGHGGEEKEREGWLQENRAGKTDFCPTLSSGFSSPRALNWLLFIGMERG